METGSELSKTVAIFIVQKIISDDMGLQFVCQTYDRFYGVASVLGVMVAQLVTFFLLLQILVPPSVSQCSPSVLPVFQVEQHSMRVLKHVVRCYLRLSDHPRARDALRLCLPDPLRDGTFSNVLKDDPSTKRWLAQLLVNLSDNMVMRDM